MNSNRYIYCLFALLFLFSCQKNQQEAIIPSTQNSTSQPEINQETLDQLIELQNQNNKLPRSIKKMLPITGKDKAQPVMYYLLYEDGGFQILSADKRTACLLAHGEKGGEELQSLQENPNLKHWIAGTTEQIEQLRADNTPLSQQQADKWTNSFQKSIGKEIRFKETVLAQPSNSSGTSKNLANLRNITWGQKGGYNDAYPGSCINGEQYPVGCMILAWGQIMKYYGQSVAQIHYNWSAMYNNSASTETANMLRNIYNKTPKIPFVSNCKNTGVFGNDLKSVMRNNGFPDANIVSLSASALQAEINAGRPAIIYGMEDTWSGHGWICDGYQYDPFIGDLYRMNWGWNGSYNGWFKLNDLTPGSSNFSWWKHIIRNITPNKFPTNRRTVYIKSNTHRYLSTENGNHWAIANRTQVGDWEKMELLKNYDGTYSIKGNNGKYADIDRGAGDYIKFNQTDRYNADCRFIITRLYGDVYSIKSVNTGKYLSSANGNHSPVRCNRYSVGYSEQWTIKDGGGTPPPPPPSTTWRKVVNRGVTLTTNQGYPSANGAYNLVMQGDGNLVLYQGNTARWHTHTYGNHGATCVFQHDGNLVIYKNGTAIWHSHTYGNSNAELEISNTGKIRIRAGSNVLWQKP